MLSFTCNESSVVASLLMHDRATSNRVSKIRTNRVEKRIVVFWPIDVKLVRVQFLLFLTHTVFKRGRYGCRENDCKSQSESERIIFKVSTSYFKPSRDDFREWCHMHGFPLLWRVKVKICTDKAFFIEPRSMKSASWNS